MIDFMFAECSADQGGGRIGNQHDDQSANGIQARKQKAAAQGRRQDIGGAAGSETGICFCCMQHFAEQPAIGFINDGPFFMISVFNQQIKNQCAAENNGAKPIGNKENQGGHP